MNLLGVFLLYHLLPSLVLGWVAWLMVMGVLRLFDQRSAFLHSSFVALPLVKSILVLIGVSTIFPLPVVWVERIQQHTLPVQTVALLFGLWAVLMGGGSVLLDRFSHRQIMKSVQEPQGTDLERLNRAADRVLAAYQAMDCCTAGELLCCASQQIPRHPRLLLSDRLHSPAALIAGGEPAVIFPRALLWRFSEEELALALAHEVNHFAIRKPQWNLTGALRWLALLSPIAFLLGEHLRREEEKACDDLAVLVMGQPECYAGMLVKSYKFAQEHRRLRPLGGLPVFPFLVGYRPILTERVERLLQRATRQPHWAQSNVMTSIAWMILCYLLFFAPFWA